MSGPIFNCERSLHCEWANLGRPHQKRESPQFGSFHAQMSVDRRVVSSTGTSEVLVLRIGDIEMDLGITEPFGKTEIDTINLVSAFANAY
jgi:hypothetical protein